MDNRPLGREKNITGEGKGIKRRGEGLGTGPVGRTGNEKEEEEEKEKGLGEGLKKVLNGVFHD